MGRYHIIVTGEKGTGHSFTIKKKAVRNTVIATLTITIILSAGTFAGMHYFKNFKTLTAEKQTVDAQLAEARSTLNKLNSEKQKLVALYNNEINRLDERSQTIQSIMDTIGVELEIAEDPEHSGGPFIATEDGYSDKLIYRADKYLEVLKKVPLGRPVPGSISSKFGYRKDPLRKTKAFHPGIDFRGQTGDDIKATADGVVKKSSRNSVLGNYIILSHGNGYETIYAHMHKRYFKKGETVKRGQVIGQIGNTGRSTGSHLHYGLRYNDKSIDPTKYMQIADLSLTLTTQ